MRHAAPASTGRHTADHQPKRRRKALIAVLTVAALAVPATLVGAVLTDHAQITGNTVSKAAFAVTATGAPMTVTDVLPGGVYSGTFTVENTGTVAADTLITFNVAGGRELLDVASATVTLAGGAAGSFSSASWTDGTVTITGLAPALPVTLTVTLAYDIELDNTAWAALPGSATFDLNVDSQQAGTPGDPTTASISL